MKENEAKDDNKRNSIYSGGLFGNNNTNLFGKTEDNSIFSQNSKSLFGNNNSKPENESNAKNVSNKE